MNPDPKHWYRYYIYLAFLDSRIKDSTSSKPPYRYRQRRVKMAVRYLSSPPPRFLGFARICNLFIFAKRAGIQPEILKISQHLIFGNYCFFRKLVIRENLCNCLQCLGNKYSRPILSTSRYRFIFTLRNFASRISATWEIFYWQFWVLNFWCKG